jgi:hypothetical protein
LELDIESGAPFVPFLALATASCRQRSNIFAVVSRFHRSHCPNQSRKTRRCCLCAGNQ